MGDSKIRSLSEGWGSLDSGFTDNGFVGPVLEVDRIKSAI
jgi:hypothetical protein